MAGGAGRVGWGAAGALAALTVVALACVGEGGGLGARLAAVALNLVTSGCVVGAVALAAYGLGWPLRSVLREGLGAKALRLAVGLGVLLTVVHGLGALGLMTRWVALCLAVGGVALGASTARRLRSGLLADARLAVWAPWVWVAGVPAGVFILAASSPPGWLWDSEFGAYDALSYHLQLPQEWLRLGRILPLEHNVYSYLPGYVESAYLFIAQATFAPVDGPGGHGLLAGTAWRAQATHALGWLLTACTAWCLGEFTSGVLARAGVPDAARRAGAWCTAGLVLATPWIAVVGTIAYNDLGVTALGAGAMLAAVDVRIRPVWRGLLAGALTGVACGCKPTAMLFVTPLVGVLLLGTAPPRRWAVLLGSAAVAGAAMLGPWMVRNWAAGGNPIFPAAADLFGTAHWSPEQAARYAAAHQPQGGLLERLRLLAWSDPAAAEGAPAVVRWRGAANPQWGVLFPAALAAGVLGWIARPARAMVGVLGAGLVLQLGAWLALTHMQSRFLAPCVLTCGPLVGMGVGVWAGRGRSTGASAGFASLIRGVLPLIRGVPGGAVVGAALVIVQTAFLVVTYASQRSGHPNARLVEGLDLDLARRYEPWVGQALPWAWVNAELDPAVRLSLLGDATPLLYERPVVYNTTWDAWPLGEAIRANPQTPGAWTPALRARKIDAVLVSEPELARLARSGWIDPAVTPAAVSAWLATLGEPAMAWPEAGRALFLLPGPEAGDE